MGKFPKLVELWLKYSDSRIARLSIVNSPDERPTQNDKPFDLPWGVFWRHYRPESFLRKGDMVIIIGKKKEPIPPDLIKALTKSGAKEHEVLETLWNEARLSFEVYLDNGKLWKL
jgi:hypothetical protein